MCFSVMLCDSAFTFIIRWILACYDVDILDYETTRTVVDIAPPNEGVDILEFDYSRKEVEVCCPCPIELL